MNTYEEKQEQKRQRLLQQAAVARKKSDDILDAAHERHKVFLGSGGQPILRRHYSEQKHLNTQKQLDASFNRATKELEKADWYEEKAKSVGKGGISSDDPDAITKLEVKVAELQAEKGKTPAKYSEIRRLKKRIADLKRLAEFETKRFSYSDYGFDLEQNSEEKRIKFIFLEKPSSSVTQLLKKRAFKYSPKKNEWTRLWTSNAVDAAIGLRNEIKKTIDGAKSAQGIVVGSTNYNNNPRIRGDE